MSFPVPGITRWLRIAALLIVVLGAALMGTGVTWNGAQAADANTSATCLSLQERQFLTLINNYRASKGLAKLKVSKTLNVASWKHSRDMGMRDYFAHETKLPLPAGQSGPLPRDRMRAAGYGYNTAKSENIAAGYGTAQAVFTGWKNSSDHNAAMLNGNLKVIGIGYAKVSGSPYTHYWTTDFGGYIDGAPVCS